MTQFAALQRAQEQRWLARATALQFRPPTLATPYVYQASAGQHRFPVAGEVAAGRAYTASDGVDYFRPDLDVIIRWPTTPLTVTQTAWIHGGRNVRSVGGKITRTGGTAVMAFSLQTGSVFCEGAHVDAAGAACDGIVVRWNQTIAGQQALGRTAHPGVTLQNCLIEGIEGAPAGVHGDGVQNQTDNDSGLDVLRLENVTIVSSYQGVLPLNGTASGISKGPPKGMWLRRVNTRDYVPGTHELFSYLFYLGTTSVNQTTPYPIHLDQVYAGEAQSTAWSLIASKPNAGDSWGPTTMIDAEGDFFDFAELGLLMTGKLRRGQPPGGDFASAANVGTNYQSPWSAI